MKKLIHYQLEAALDTSLSPNDSRLYVSISLPRGSEITGVFNATFGIDNKFCISVLETDTIIMDTYTFMIVSPSQNYVEFMNTTKSLGIVQSQNNEYYDVFYQIVI